MILNRHGYKKAPGKAGFIPRACARRGPPNGKQYLYYFVFQNLNLVNTLFHGIKYG
jgi:hypothetical protein